MKNVTDGNPAQLGTSEVLAIVGATIIDGNGGKPIDSGVILVDGKRIRAVGDGSISIPPHAKQIRATGKFVIPGLMDPNAYLLLGGWAPDLIRCEGRYDEVVIEAAQLALKGGITTVFDSLGPRDPLLKARAAINEGRASGARIYLCGNWVGLGGPFSSDLYDHGDEAVGAKSQDSKMAVGLAAASAAFRARINALWEINIGENLTRMSVEEARQEVREHLQSGIDFVSYLVNSHRLGAYHLITLSPRVQRMIVEEAHRAGLPVKAVFATTDEGVYLGLDSGADIVVPAPWGGKPMSAATLALIVQRGAVVNYSGVPPASHMQWYRRQPPGDLYPGTLTTQEALELEARAVVRAGAQIICAGESAMRSPEQQALFNSSAMPPGCMPEIGTGHIGGLQGLQDVGMTPMAALMAATRNVARAYKVDKDLGTLERGKFADLVVLDRNPLEDSQNYREIHLVMKDGKVIDRDALPTQRLWTLASAKSS